MPVKYFVSLSTYVFLIHALAFYDVFFIGSESKSKLCHHRNWLGLIRSGTRRISFAESSPFESRPSVKWVSALFDICFAQINIMRQFAVYSRIVNTV